jgi:hypothetical protein
MRVACDVGKPTQKKLSGKRSVLADLMRSNFAASMPSGPTSPTFAA